MKSEEHSPTKTKNVEAEIKTAKPVVNKLKSKTNIELLVMMKAASTEKRRLFIWQELKAKKRGLSKDKICLDWLSTHAPDQAVRNEAVAMLNALDRKEKAAGRILDCQVADALVVHSQSGDHHRQPHH